MLTVLIFMGITDFVMLKSLIILEDKDVLDLKAHLGDWMDGSDPGLVGEAELISLSRTFRSKKLTLLSSKGNHDENDKFDGAP